MLNFFFRIALFLLGAWLTYTFGLAMAKTISYRFSGTTVEGRVIGFTRMRGGKSVQEEGSGVRNGKRRNRLPVFRYAVPNADSLTKKSHVAALVTFSQFDLGEKVSVVHSEKNPSDAYIFSFQLLFTNLILLLFSMFMMSLGWRRSL